MNKGTIKVQEKGQCADLRDNKVDGHLLAGEKIEDLELLEEVFVEFLELSNSAAAREAELGL